MVDSEERSTAANDAAGTTNAAQLSGQADQPVSQEFDIDIGRFVLALWTRKWLILTLSGLIFLIAAIVIMSMSPTYQATAQILIDPADELTKIQAVSSPLARDSQAISSEIEVIRSSDIARQLIDAVDFQSYAELPLPPSKLDSLLGLSPGLAESLKQFRKKTEGLLSAKAETDSISENEIMESYYSALGVARVSGTYVISINFQTLDPHFSAEAANQLAAIYIANQIERKKNTREQASALLTGNLAKLENEIQRSNKEVEQYRQESGIDDAPSTELIGQQLTLQTTQLVNARSSAQALNAKLQNMVDLQQTGRLEELLSIVNSKPAQARWQDVLRGRRVLATAGQDYGPNHPEIIRLTKELEDAETSLENQLSNAVEAARIQAVGASSKVAELESLIIELRRSMTELKEKENELKQLRADSDISRTLHELLTSRIREAESAVVEGADARILNLAEPPQYPSSKPKKILLLAALAAAFTVSSVTALGLEFLNGGYQSEEALRRSLGWPILATVPKKRRLKLFGKFRSGRKASAYDEAFNILLTNLEIHGLDFGGGQAVAVMVTSSIPAEGKSTIVRDLAAIAVEGGSRVLVIDADLRKPTVHKQFGVRQAPGLTNCDLSHFSENLITGLIAKDPKTGVDVLPAGDNKVRPQQLLKSSVLPQIINAERRNYDLILLDTPPVLAVSDALLVGKRCDAAIFVIKWSSTARRLVQRAVVRFSKGGVALAGCVLTQVSKSAHRIGTHQYLDYR